MKRNFKLEKIDTQGLKQDFCNQGENYPETLQTLADLLNYGFDFDQDPVLKVCVLTYLATGEIEKRGDKYYSNGPKDITFSSMEEIKEFLHKIEDDKIFKVHKEDPRKNRGDNKLYKLKPEHTIH